MKGRSRARRDRKQSKHGGSWSVRSIMCKCLDCVGLAEVEVMNGLSMGGHLLFGYSLKPLGKMVLKGEIELCEVFSGKTVSCRW